MTGDDRSLEGWARVIVESGKQARLVSGLLPGQCTVPVRFKVRLGGDPDGELSQVCPGHLAAAVTAAHDDFSSAALVTLVSQPGYACDWVPEPDELADHEIPHEHSVFCPPECNMGDPPWLVALRVKEPGVRTCDECAMRTARAYCPGGPGGFTTCRACTVKDACMECGGPLTLTGKWGDWH